MRITKKLIAATLLAAMGIAPLLPSAQANAAATPASVKFQVNSKTYTDNKGSHTLDVAPFIRNGSSMVPLRALAQSLGADVAWNPATQTATLGGQAFRQLTLKANDLNAYVGAGTKVKLTEAPVRINGLLFVPVKSVASLIGAEVSWTAATKSLTIANKADSSQTLEYSYDFNKGEEGWTGQFADLPVQYDPSIYELQYSRELLPLSGNKANYGLKLNGSNRSDDLFMFLTKKIEGLKPNSEYAAKLSFGMYSSESNNRIGIGGAPGEAVTVKAGILGVEPKAVTKEEGAGESYYRLNVDKGNQTEDGADVKSLGNIVKPDSSKEGYQLVPFQYEVVAKTSANGELYILIGTDSGYEGLTTLYFDDVKLSATPR